MELINKYKFKCIYDTIIKDRLLTIFYDRWLIESGQPWKNNAAFGCIIRNQLPLVYNKFDEDMQIYLENGQIYKLNYHNLVEILLNSNKLIKNNTNEIIINQNKIIKTIHEYHNENNFEIIIELIKKLDKSTGREDNDIQTEINNIFKDDNSSMVVRPNVNLVNENKAIEMNKKGMVQINENNLIMAMEYFRNSMDLENISYYIQGELYLNMGVVLYGFVQENLKIYNIIKDNGVFLIKESIKRISASIPYRPCIAIGYYKLAIIKSNLGEYKEALELFQSSLILDQSLKNDVNECINKINDKIRIRNQSMIHGCRNYEKESKFIIQNYRSLNQFYQNNNNSKLNSFIDRILNNQEKLYLYNLAKSNGLNQNFIYERAIIDHAMHLKYDSKSDIKLKLECYGVCISNRTEWADAYYNYAILKTRDPVSESNDKLIVSLLLKASLLPLVHSQIKYKSNMSRQKINYYHNEYDLINNYSVNSAFNELGTIYRFGLYGEDVDLEKAQYYLELTVKNYKNVEEIIKNQPDKISFYILGHMFFTGVNKDGIEDLDKAKKYWLMGSEVGEENCINYLKKYFNNEQQQEVVLFGSHANSKDLEIGIVEIDFKMLNGFVNFNLIKEISVNKQHPSYDYANCVYLTHLKILKFTRQFKEFESKKRGGGKLKDKFEIIKILASAFRDYQNCFFIRIPQAIINDVKELVDQLLESSPSNIDVRICKLGLSRITNYLLKYENFKSTLQFIQESINLCKNEKDYLIFKYFEIVFHGYRGETNNQFNNIIQLLTSVDSDDGATTNSKQQEHFKISNPVDNDVFIYFLLLSIINDNTTTSSSLFQTIKDQYLDLIISNVDSYNSRSIKGNPQNVEINFNLYLLLSKLNDNDENEEISKLSNKYYEIGFSAFKYLTPALNILELKMKKICSLIENKNKNMQ